MAYAKFGADLYGMPFFAKIVNIRIFTNLSVYGHVTPALFLPISIYVYIYVNFNTTTSSLAPNPRSA